MISRFAHQTRSQRLVAALATVMALPACAVNVESAPPLPYEADRRLERSLEIAPGTNVRIENLAGSLRMEPADGSILEVEAVVHAGGQQQDEADALAERIQLVLEESSGARVLRSAFPVDDDSEFYFPRDGESRFFFGMFDTSSTRLEYMGRRVRVSGRRSGRSASVWVDLLVRVPIGTRLEVLNAVGRAESASVSGEVRLEVHMGSIRWRDGEGTVALDTGSGSITVEGHRGEVVADTGSGRVEMSATWLWGASAMIRPPAWWSTLAAAA